MKEFNIRPNFTELNTLSIDRGSKCLVVAGEQVDQAFMHALCSLVIDAECALFAVWGVDCTSWEDVMDDLIVERLSNEVSHSGYTLTTTSHPEETLQDAIDFVSVFSCGDTKKCQK
ncbi:DUF7684 family protein [Maritalea sp. S77]|uniref:DUF7684 family protein n=1 Tax=Maritalea sp. S77 TaxID=3415125 RepID=UPI003C7BBF2A